MVFTSEIGKRFRVKCVDDGDAFIGVRVGDTGTFLEASSVPWCRMDRMSQTAPIGDKAPRKAPAMRETSLQAHESQKDKAPSDRATILGRVTQSPMGITCDALEQGLGLSHQTASARLNDLVRMGKIKDSGRREDTRTGRKAICWVVMG